MFYYIKYANFLFYLKNNKTALNKPNSILFETQRKNDRKVYEELLLKMTPHCPFGGKFLFYTNLI